MVRCAPVLEGAIMKRTALRARQLPIAWRDFDYAVLRHDAADTFADRVGEEPLDAEDDRRAVEGVLRGINRDVS